MKNKHCNTKFCADMSKCISKLDCLWLRCIENTLNKHRADLHNMMFVPKEYSEFDKLREIHTDLMNWQEPLCCECQAKDCKLYPIIQEIMVDMRKELIDVEVGNKYYE